MRQLRGERMAVWFYDVESLGVECHQVPELEGNLIDPLV